MTYLHGKNIVHGRLTSVNIYMEPNQRVKISLIDNDEKPIAVNSEQDNRIEFNATTLTYLSPELIRTLKVKKIANTRGESRQPDSDGGEGAAPVHVDINHLTKKSDIFSFGTIVYELFHNRLPFDRMSAAEIIYRIGSGLMDTIGAECPALVKQTISACWLVDAHARPDFKDIKFDINQ